MKNAPQVCCLSTRLRGLLSLIYNYIVALMFCKSKHFFTIGNSNFRKNYIFHIFSRCQSLGNPIELIFTKFLYSFRSSIKRPLNCDEGFAVCNK